MKLNHVDLKAELASLPDWIFHDERGGIIQREFIFDDFIQAFGFISQTAIYAEKHNHHPEWFNVYNRVKVLLTTHDVDGISMNDIEMARFMDRIAAITTVNGH